MAARKKTTAKKHSATRGKKSATAKKAKARSPAAAKGKPVHKKAALSKTTQAPAKKNPAQKIRAGKKPAASQRPAGEAADSQPSSGKKPGAKNLGRKITTLTGRRVGQQGVIVRQDTALGTYFVTFDAYRNNPVYKSLEWGPYFESQLGFLKK
ncbi:MAG TPA: hypothetical protein VIM41_15270 [Gammaproteobacteria bacterium]